MGLLRHKRYSILSWWVAGIWIR